MWQRIVRAILVALMIASSTASADPLLEGGVDPQRVRQIAQMLGDQPFAFGPKIDDRKGRQQLAATKAYVGTVKDAEKALKLIKAGERLR